MGSGRSLQWTELLTIGSGSLRELDECPGLRGGGRRSPRSEAGARSSRRRRSRASRLLHTSFLGPWDFVGLSATQRVSREARRDRAPSRPRSAPPPRIWRGHGFARPRARRRRRSPRSDAFARAPARPSFGGAVPPCAPGPLASSVSAREGRVTCQTRPRAACRLQRLAALVPGELGLKRLRTRCCALVRRGARGFGGLCHGDRFWLRDANCEAAHALRRNSFKNRLVE